jgi:predicted amidophosphoribosyltransferase
VFRIVIGEFGRINMIKPQNIYGNWLYGVALDIHTLSSLHVGFDEAGHDVFDTKRTELGELLYQLKYRGNKDVVQDIVDAAASFLKPHRSKLDILVPVPPSGHRTLQPVITLARGIGAAINLPVVECVTLSRPAEPLKGVREPEKRHELLQDRHEVDASQTRGKNVLLFDDLYRSGSTLNAVATLVSQRGNAVSIRVLAITKTRSHR